MGIRNIFDVVGVCTYKAYSTSKAELEVHVTDRRGTVHTLVAYGRDADLYFSYMYVHNTYRIKLCHHDTYGTVICGVEFIR